MDRRDFLKKTAYVAAGAAVATPVAVLVGKTESLGQTEGGARHEGDSKLQITPKANGKMKVLMINGSPRRDGNTNLALQEIEKQLQKYGIETEIVQIGNRPVRMCINCGACSKGEGCAFKDDVYATVAPKLADADALIVGSPVYYGQPNGGILSLMQRLFYSVGELVQNKPAAAVAVCRRGGATAAFQSLNMMFQMMNMPVVTSQYWNIVYGAGKGEAKLDAEGMQTMRTLGHNMAWLLEKIHAGGNAAPVREDKREWTNFIRG